MTSMITPRARLGAGRIGIEVFAIGGEIYTFCNASNSNEFVDSNVLDPVDTIEKYDTVFDIWSPEEDELPSELFRFDVLSLADRNGGMYIFGGQSSFVLINNETGYGFYPVSNHAYRYIPTSISSSHDFSKAEIMGIIISAVLIALLLILAPYIVSRMIRVDTSKQHDNSIRKYEMNRKEPRSISSFGENDITVLNQNPVTTYRGDGAYGHNF